MGGEVLMQALSIITCRWCGSRNVQFELTPDKTHFGKYVCGDCGKFIQWAKKPKEKPKYLVQDEDGYYVVAFGKNKGFRLIDVANTAKGMRWLDWVIGNPSIPEWVKQLCNARRIEAENKVTAFILGEESWELVHRQEVDETVEPGEELELDWELTLE
jgi:DNA-directed RNA polymerase subunit RPC12/RpoP